MHLPFPGLSFFAAFGPFMFRAAGLIFCPEPFDGPEVGPLSVVMNKKTRSQA
jgi:hypothetical protein